MSLFDTSVYGESQDASGCKTVADALKVADLNFNVGLRQMYYGTTEGTDAQVPEHYAVVREDTDHCYTVVGNRYEVIQHSEAFGVIDTLISQGRIKLDRVQAMRDGVKAMVVTKGEDMEIAGEPVASYMAWMNSHDGKTTVSMTPTPTRMFCTNIFHFRIGTHKNACYKIRHTRFSPLKLMQTQHEMFGTDRLDAELQEMTLNQKEVAADAARAMNFYEQYTDKLKAALDPLANKKITNKKFEDLLKRLVPLPENEGGPHTKAIQKQADIRAVYLTDDNLNNLRGTALGFLNAVTQVHQHMSAFTSTDRKIETVLTEPRNIGQKAFDLVRSF